MGEITPEALHKAMDSLWNKTIHVCGDLPCYCDSITGATVELPSGYGQIAYEAYCKYVIAHSVSNEGPPADGQLPESFDPAAWDEVAKAVIAYVDRIPPFPETCSYCEFTIRIDPAEGQICKSGAACPYSGKRVRFSIRNPQ